MRLTGREDGHRQEETSKNMFPINRNQLVRNNMMISRISALCIVTTTAQLSSLRGYDEQRELRTKSTQMLPIGTECSLQRPTKGARLDAWCEFCRGRPQALEGGAAVASLPKKAIATNGSSTATVALSIQGPPYTTARASVVVAVPRIPTDLSVFTALSTTQDSPAVAKKRSSLLRVRRLWSG